MEIRFCDICNESVPEADLARGRAFERKGRVICASCDLAMSSAAHAPGEGAPGALVGAGTPAAGSAAGARVPVAATVEARGEGVALALAAVALVGVGAVAYLARVEVDRVAREGAGERAALAEGWQRERASLADEARQRAEALVAERDRRDAELSGQRDQARAEVAALEARVAEAEFVGRQLSTQLAERATAAGGERGTEARLVELEGALATVREDVEVLARTLLDTVHRAVPADVAATTPGGNGDAPPAPPASEPFREHLPALASADPIERWTAVDAIGMLRDPAAAPHVVPLLSDADLFVRMAAARVLGELGSGDAVPALIGALEDEEPSVREQAVMALRSITGRSFAFDPNGSVAERGRQVAAWRDWWKRNGGAANGSGEVE